MSSVPSGGIDRQPSYKFNTWQPPWWSEDYIPINAKDLGNGGRQLSRLERLNDSLHRMVRITRSVLRYKR